jgi:hypothetical protein
LLLAVAIWSLLAGACWYSLAAYGLKTDGPVRRNSNAWPADSELTRSSGCPRLLVFVHPKCPCSQATITELHKALTAARSADFARPQVTIVASIPTDAHEHHYWRRTPLLTRAEQLLPAAEVVLDSGGAEAGRFGAHTSGTALLFDRDGRRLYAGGVTAARGHEGANAGADALARLLRGEPGGDPLPPLGCPLVSAAALECGEQCTLVSDHVE